VAPTFGTMSRTDEEERYREIFRQAHAEHPGCLADEWLAEPCRAEAGAPVDRPLVWSRRNGAWRQVDVLWVGAAPGNAGGMGAGSMGAHGTRIPFGGDVAGANLDVLLSAAGLDRNRTFIVAALNQLPERGGGEPRVSEIVQPVGSLPSSLHLLRSTLLASGARLVVALGNVALRTTVAAGRLEDMARLTLPGLPALVRAGAARRDAFTWPADFPPDAGFLAAWERHWQRPVPRILWTLHPSAQNMSPFAGMETVFHVRMVETVAAVRRAAAEVLGVEAPGLGSRPPAGGIYSLPEWVEAVGPRHQELIRLWRERGLFAG
jgi:uracil-DNA glycosylase